MKFTKMHGLGNDYVYINGFTEKMYNIENAAVILSDRHTGAGSDGIVIILPSDKADFRMRMFNADGSEAEMCGNAIRCVGKYVYDNRMTQKEFLLIETLAGIKKLWLSVENGTVTQIKADMGEPILKSELIPVVSNEETFIDKPIVLDDEVFNVTAVSMGNPHAVTFVPEPDNFPLHIKGPLMEKHSLFPKKVNAEFVKIIDRQNIYMRVWERGSGETMACGTGACAVLVASVLNRKTDRKATVRLKGGNLTIEWKEEDNRVYMTGPAQKVYEAVVDAVEDLWD